MAYAPLSSPLPGLTVSEGGCQSCGMRGLGDDFSVDTTYTDPGGGLIDPYAAQPYADPFASDPSYGSLTPGPLEPDLPLAPPTPSLNLFSPNNIGTNFVLDPLSGEYMNLQTGQLVPQSTAEAITAASTGPATSNLDTTATGQGPEITITDPN